jgi:Mg-chelatase subunit ChlI
VLQSLTTDGVEGAERLNVGVAARLSRYLQVLTQARKMGKDRISSQIVTHYPDDVKTAAKITAQEAWLERADEPRVEIPDFFRELVEEVAFAARSSEFVDQSSGVSARMPILDMVPSKSKL